MRAKLLLPLLALISTACLEDPPTEPSTVNGTYTLRTVNGAPLPFAIPGDADQTTILQAALVLYQGGTYSESGSRSRSTNGVVSVIPYTDAGAYQLLGTSVTLVSGINSQTRLAQYRAGRMTIIEAGLTAVYAK